MVGHLTKHLRNRDFLSGALFMLCGAGFLWLAQELSFGSSRSMGPAYFPTLMAITLIIIGAIVLLRSFFTDSGGVEGVAVKGAGLVTVGTIAFGALIQSGGLIVATIAIVMISSLGSQKFSLTSALALGIGLAAACAFLFVKILGLPIPILGEWLSL
jgi:putative tricarboxylic transport membrane protein